MSARQVEAQMQASQTQTPQTNINKSWAGQLRSVFCSTFGTEAVTPLRLQKGGVGVVLCETRCNSVNTVNAVRRQILDSVSVERFPKLDVAGSNPVSRSITHSFYAR